MKTKSIKQANRMLLLWIAGMLLSVQAFAQVITVNGLVKDSMGEPIIGANLIVK